MIIRPWVFAAALALAACEGAPKPRTDIDILNSYRALNVKVDRVAAPILKAGLGLCPVTKETSGAALHKLTDYPKKIRSTAKTHFKLMAEDSVFFVRANSPADKAGIKPGEIVSASRLAKLAAGNDTCGYDVRIRYSQKINAYADGKTIIVTSEMIENTDDLSLSLIVAHELAHNILGHRAEDDSAIIELIADRWALFLLARAGLDYERATRSEITIAPPHANRSVRYFKARAREAHYNDVIQEIKALEEQGAPLNPRLSAKALPEPAGKQVTSSGLSEN